jgi:hypothetical protein
VDRSGQSVILRGYNIGGWMNMENFLTGYPGTESQQRRVLHRVLGPELYEAFFDQFMTVFFDDADASYLAGPAGLGPARSVLVPQEADISCSTNILFSIILSAWQSDP